MTLCKYQMTCDQNQAQELTPLAGEENTRGAEKPQGFFSLGGAPSDPLTAEKPGGLFSGLLPGERLKTTGRASSQSEKKRNPRGGAGGIPPWQGDPGARCRGGEGQARSANGEAEEGAEIELLSDSQTTGSGGVSGQRFLCSQD